MARYPFLSPEWIAAARALHDDYVDRVEPPDQAVRVNVTITDAPFGDGLVLGHLDTTTGSTVPDEGHVDEPDLSVTVPYAVARQLLVDQHYENLMVAFMSGEIEVQGDVTLLMELQDVDPTPEQQALGDEVAERLRSITELD